MLGGAVLFRFLCKPLDCRSEDVAEHVKETTCRVHKHHSAKNPSADFSAEGFLHIKVCA